MFKSKYGIVLTILLIILVLGILGLLGFLGYDYYQKYIITKETSEYVENFRGELSDGDDTDSDTDLDNNSDSNTDNDVELEKPSTSTGNNGSDGDDDAFEPYNGFGVVGIIEIPATSVDLPILERDTRDSLDASVAFQYGVGLNEVGNNVIVGHNYRNGLFFSNNDKLELGDKIYITAGPDRRMEYEIYEIFITSSTDTSFFQRNTNGLAEITLSSCTDDGQERIIVLARQV